MNLTGTLHEISNEEQITDKFKKREFIIKDDSNEQFPQFIKFELNNDKCSLLDKYSLGERVDVHFNLKGRINKNGICFNQLQAWKLE